MSYGFAQRIVFFSWRMLLTVLTLSPAIALAQAIPKDPNEPNKETKEHKASSKDVKERLQKGFDHKNVAYEGSNIQVAVDDKNVTLTGTVTSELQHEMAVQLARAYGEDRNIVDQLKTPQQ